MRRFLGLDIIARLSNDIERYLDECMRAEGGTRENASLRNRMLDVQKLKDHLNTELESVLVERLQLSERKNKAEILLKRSERQLVSQGGTYAEKRQFLQEQHNRLESDHQARQNALIDLCNDLLPFSLVPELLHDLESTLKREADQKRKDLAADLFKDTCRSLVRTFEDESLWNGLNVHAETRDELLRRLSSAVNSYPLNGLRESTVIHDITDIERQRITEWIRIAATETPNKVERLCDDLRSLDQMIVKIRIEMDKAPDDVLLAHVYQEIHEAQAEVSDLILEESKIQETIGTLQYRISETDRELRIMRDKLIKLQSAEHNLDLASRSLLVLKTYEDALVRTKIQDIEEKIVRSFNTLCHKSRLLSRITIDLDDYSLSLYSTNDKKIFLSDLSAGERQLYVISLLWALRQVSEKDIPLFVDTPVAKLDELHGWQLMHDFFPRVSNQVILFAHTKEMDNGLLQEAAFYTARRYKLDFDDTRKRTQVQCEESPVSGLLIR
ncbi:DNA sulfur modification protein DndD [Dehalococcoides mccartyi]|nr:DNA sulfur modification protein DndD [Dehalococcoides mccartyi]